MKEKASAYALVGPSVLALGVVAAYPLLAAIYLSLQRFFIVFKDRQFIGLDNYAFLVSDGRFWIALRNTAYFSGVAVLVEVVLGLGVALLLNKPLRGQGLLRAAVLVPWAIPTVVSARMWAWLFHPEHGLLPHLFSSGDSNWIGTPGPAMHAAILVDVWKTTPFVSLLLLAGLQTIPQDVYKAARIDGASAWRTFVFVTLPLLRPAIAVTLLFRLLDAVRVFDAVYVLTEGGPANTTETLSIYAYKTLMRSGDFGYGSTLAVATFLAVALVSAFYLRFAGGSVAKR